MQGLNVLNVKDWMYWMSKTEESLRKKESTKMQVPGSSGYTGWYTDDTPEMRRIPPCLNVPITELHLEIHPVHREIWISVFHRNMYTEKCFTQRRGELRTTDFFSLYTHRNLFGFFFSIFYTQSEPNLDCNCTFLIDLPSIGKC